MVKVCSEADVAAAHQLSDRGAFRSPQRQWPPATFPANGTAAGSGFGDSGSR